MADTTTPSQYLLRWNDHLANYCDMFLSIRDQDDFVDCSIACVDGMVGAHRVILAGCSPYLRDLFRRVTNPHPVIFLLNISCSLVQMLLEFIYEGQVYVPQHCLQELVTLGQALKIKGLTQISLPAAANSPKRSEPSSSNDLNAMPVQQSPHITPATDSDNVDTPLADSDGTQEQLQNSKRKDKSLKNRSNLKSKVNRYILKSKVGCKPTQDSPKRPRGRPRKSISSEFVPALRESSSFTSECTSLTPLAFPLGLPMTWTPTSLPFATSLSNNSTSMDTTPHEPKEQERDEQKDAGQMEEEEEEEKENSDNAEKQNISSGRPRGRPPGQKHVRKSLDDESGVQPLRTFYNRPKAKVEIGEYALTHGIEAAQSAHEPVGPQPGSETQLGTTSTQPPDDNISGLTTADFEGFGVDEFINKLPAYAGSH